MIGLAIVGMAIAWGVVPQAVLAQGGGGETPPEKAPEARAKEGKWLLPDGTPSFGIAPDGTVDWYAYSGYQRYHAECHRCHGPDGEGGSYAPALATSLKTMSYRDFLTVVENGRINVENGKESVMPALGKNKNVICFIDDIYVYLKARSAGALPRGRPEKRAAKPQAATKYENACFE